jgi:hypothetical protein
VFGLSPRIYLAAGATDMRKGFEGFAAILSIVESCRPLKTSRT